MAPGCSSRPSGLSPCTSMVISECGNVGVGCSNPGSNPNYPQVEEVFPVWGVGSLIKFEGASQAPAGSECRPQTKGGGKGEGWHGK